MPARTIDSTVSLPAVRHTMCGRTPRRASACSIRAWSQIGGCATIGTPSSLLTAAGFTEVGFTDVHEPVYYGPDSATAFDAVLRLWEFKDLLASLDAPAAEQARARLRATLDAHTTDGGVYFDSRAWIVTARRGH